MQVLWMSKFNGGEGTASAAAYVAPAALLLVMVFEVNQDTSPVSSRLISAAANPPCVLWR
jgi:hypothetical protein